MAQPSTIDRKSLTRSADMFAESMVAFLDTEMDYIEYLRERNGGVVEAEPARDPREMPRL